MQVIKKAVHFYNHIESWLMVLSFAVTLGLVGLQVVLRYVFNSSMSWSDELVRYIFVWQCWMGASMAVVGNKHLRVDIIFSITKGKGKNVAELAAAVIWLVFCIILTVVSFELMMSVFEKGVTAVSLPIPMYIPFAAVPVGNTLMSLRLIGVIVEQVKILMGPPLTEIEGRN